MARPFTMTVQSIKITDGSTNTSSYAYGDETGSYSSITTVDGESAAYKDMNEKATSSAQKLQQHWAGLSTGAKIGIAAGVGGAALIGAIAFIAFCCVQRKRGRRERLLEDQQWNEQTAELMQYRKQMAQGRFAVDHLGHGEKY